MVGDDPEALVSDLQSQFPHEALAADERFDAKLVDKVVNLIDEPHAQAVDLPLDVRGTDFQLSVWEALREVPSARPSAIRSC